MLSTAPFYSLRIVIDMRLTEHGLKAIEEAFNIRNGAWTRDAVSYLGLSHPLKAGWKQRLINEDLPEHAPLVKGITVGDHLYLCGRDINQMELIEEKKAHESARAKNEHLYVMSQLDALESVASDLRQQADALREQVRDLRKSISEDDF